MTHDGQELATDTGEAIEGTLDDANASASVEPQGNEGDQNTDDLNQTDQDNPDAGDQPFPKKAVNKINRQQREIRKLRAQKRELEAMMANTPKKEASAEDKEPVDSDYDSYADFLKDRQDWLMKQYQKSQEEQSQQTNFSNQQQAIRSQQDQFIANTAEQLIQSNPEFAQVMAQNAALIDQMPPQVEELMYELDDPIAAGFALAKEGRLAEIYGMHPAMAAAELIQAQARGAAMLDGSTAPAAKAGGAQQPPMQRPQTSQAPKPMASAKGAGTSTTKTLNDMGPEELLKWAKS